MSRKPTSPNPPQAEPQEPPPPDAVLAVAVKRDEKGWYQILTVHRIAGEVSEKLGRRTDNKLIAATWLEGALLDSTL